MKNWTDLQIKFTYLWSGEESFYSLFDCPKSDETGSHLLLFSDRTWLNGWDHLDFIIRDLIFIIRLSKQM